MFTSNASTKSASISAPKFFRFNILNDTIEGSEFNFKKAGDPTSAQYAELMALKATQPTFKFAPIASTKKVEKKQSYEGLTIDLMEAYLDIYEGEMAEDARAKFAEMKEKKEQKKMAYPTIKSWFLELFPKFNVNKAKLEIKAKKLESAKAPYKVVKAKKVKATPAVVEMPIASNF